MKNHKYICDRFDVLLVSVLFSAVRPIQSTSKSSFAKGADVGWFHKWKLQDINFMILTGSKRLFTALKDRGMNTIRLRVWVNQMMIKPVDTAARKKLL
jgi:arabinogalactan endo-1,4-beta-galactosidase